MDSDVSRRTSNIGYTFSSGKLDPVVTDLTEPSGLQGPFYRRYLEGVTPYNTDLSVPDEANYTFGTEIPCRIPR